MTRDNRTNRMNFEESTREKVNPSTTSSYNNIKEHNSDSNRGNSGVGKDYSYNDKYKSSTSVPRREVDEKSSTRQGYRSKVTNLNDRRQTNEPLDDSEKDENKEIKDRSNRKDNYNTSLSNIIYKIEDVYGLRVPGSTGKAISNLPINAFMSELQVIVKQMSLIERQDKRKAVGAQIAELMFVQSYLRFFRTSKLNFSNFEGIRQVSHVLSLAIQYDKDTNLAQHINVLVRSLQTCDRMNPHSINTLSYRYIRLFIITVVTADLVHASVLAEFILNQINDSEIGERRSARR